MALAAVEAGAPDDGPELPAVFREAAAAVALPSVRRSATVGGCLSNGVVPSQLLPALFVLGARIGLVSPHDERQEVVLATGWSEHGWLAFDRGTLVGKVKIPQRASRSRQSFLSASRSNLRRYVVAATYDEVAGLRMSVLTTGGWWRWELPADGTVLPATTADSYAVQCLDDVLAIGASDRASELLLAALLRRSLRRLGGTDGRRADA